MKHYLLLIFTITTSLLFSQKRNLDEVWLKNGSSLTGKLRQCNDTALVIQHADHSQSRVPWADIDTVTGLNLPTRVFSAHLGWYRSSYHSAFEQQDYVVRNAGMQASWGRMYWKKRYRYWNLSLIPSQPYTISKVGYGFARFVSGHYALKHALSVGGEINLMNVQRNNAPTITVEPFGAYYYRLHPQLLLSLRLGLQRSLFSRNEAWGMQLSMGTHFLLRNFDDHYTFINREKRLPRYFNHD